MQAATMLDFILANADKNSADTAYRALALKWLNLVIKDIQNSQEGFHYRFLETTGVLTLVGEQFNYDLVTAFSTIDTTKAINVYDKINDLPLYYFPYDIFRQRIAKESRDTGDPRWFSIWSGDLLLWPVPDFTALTGTADAIVADKLSDSTATFTTDGVKVGMRVTNTVAGTTALVTAVDSATALSLDTDIFTLGTEAYTISYVVSVDYVSTITAATDAAVDLVIPNKYEKVVIDGVMEYAYIFDPELGSAADQNARYKDGLARMIRDNEQIIAENKMPVSHRTKYRLNNDIDRKNSTFFPAGGENF